MHEPDLVFRYRTIKVVDGDKVTEHRVLKDVCTKDSEGTLTPIDDHQRINQEAAIRDSNNPSRN